MTPQTTFAPADHRRFNREGAAFHNGETFAGIDFDLGLEAVEELERLFAGDSSMALWALRWVPMSERSAA